MANSGDGDKFGSLIIPNCQRTASQEENLQSCPFARESKANSEDNIQASEQDTGIAMFTLPESSDEYHTPPEHQSCSQNSSNEGQIPPTKISAFDQMEVDSPHQVFVEMPQRKQEANNREKRKLPFSMKTRNESSNCSKHEAFTSSLNRVLKTVGEGRSRGGEGEDDEVDVDFFETAKMRGLTLPSPRWWPAKGFKD